MVSKVGGLLASFKQAALVFTAEAKVADCCGASSVLLHAIRTCAPTHARCRGDYLPPLKPVH